MPPGQYLISPRIYEGADLLDFSAPCELFNWMKRFTRFKAGEGYPPYIVDRLHITDGGISTGLNEALAIIALVPGDLVAQEVQLNTQYNPCPPFTNGRPSVAKPPTYTRAPDAPAIPVSLRPSLKPD
jgi:hypothetical protein